MKFTLPPINVAAMTPAVLAPHDTSVVSMHNWQNIFVSLNKNDEVQSNISPG